MTLEAQVSAMTSKVDEVLKAVNVQKSYLDAAAKSAIAGVTAQGAMVPTPAKSPLGNDRGVFDPAWLDQNVALTRSLPVGVGQTAKMGYNFLSQGQNYARWHWIATIPQEHAGNYSKLTIRGLINTSWSTSTTSVIEIMMGVRGGFYVDWTLRGPMATQSRFIVYAQDDGIHQVFAYFEANAYSTLSFDLGGIGCDTYSNPTVLTDNPAGRIVFDTAQVPGTLGYMPPRMKSTTGSQPGNLATSFNDSVFAMANQQDGISNSFLAGAPLQALAGKSPEVLGLGVAGIPGFAYPGRFGWVTNGGSSLYSTGYSISLQAFDSGTGAWSPSLLKVQGNGVVSMPLLKAGSTDKSTTRHSISRTASQGEEILYISRDGSTAPCVGVLGSTGEGGWNAINSVLYVGKHGNTGRSISTGGTIGTSGNDFAEYATKVQGCMPVEKGQIVGLTDLDMLTDKWADAVMFVIKSTDPSFVGGDSWGRDAGARPIRQAGAAPQAVTRKLPTVEREPLPLTNPVEYQDLVTEPGDTDAEWAAKQAQYDAALLTHTLEVQREDEQLAAFEEALELERQKVDRIAIAGRVPVNVVGAKPGDYIVPVQDGEGIGGVAIDEGSITMPQYLKSVGKVIRILPDGRAYVMVKVG